MYKKRIISLIVAANRQDVIGNNGEIPWSPIKADMRRFRELTTGKPIVMGRKTWESLPEPFRPLPKRVNIVLSRQKELRCEGAFTAFSLESALDALQTEEICIIGGGGVYVEALPFADIIHFTRVKNDEPGDTYFHLPTTEDWFKEVDEAHIDDCIFQTYRRRIAT